MQRATLARPTCIRELGVRSGRDIELVLEPAEIGSGLTLVRADLGEEWPLDLAHSHPGLGCTASGEGVSEVAFVEHLLAALAATGVTDACVILDGPEVPMFDGSALPLLELIEQAGVAGSGVELHPLLVREPVLVTDQGAAAFALPGEPPEVACALQHEHPLIGASFASFRPDVDDFAAHLAPARTFITVEEAEALRGAGLLQAGSEENALVVYPDHLSEEPTLPDAFARHKLVDLIGDLYLLGRPVLGRVFAFHTGHRHNHALATALAAQASDEG